MLSEKLTKALSEQINVENYSAYLYLASEMFREALALADIGQSMSDLGDCRDVAGILPE